MNYYLMLVNKYNLLNENVINQVEKSIIDVDKGGIMYDGKIHKSQKLSNEIIINFNLLKEQLQKKGYNFFVESGFRAYNSQVKLIFSRILKDAIKEYGFPPFNFAPEQTERLIAYLCVDNYPDWYKTGFLGKIEDILSVIGKTGKHELEKIKENVELTVAMPGASEHHLGIAFDIGLIDNKGRNCDLTDKNHQKAAFEFMNVAPNYGFILRYPEGKRVFTGCNPEIWHYRFVGSPLIAHEIMDNGLTLEEYHIANHILSDEQLTNDFLNDSINLDFLSKYIGKESSKIVSENIQLLDSIKNYIYLKMKNRTR